MPKSLLEVYGFSSTNTKKKNERLSNRQLRNVFLKEAYSLIKEEADDLAKQVQTAGAKPITLVVLYGPPAAGKGAAKKDIGTFIGGVEQNFEDWLDDIGDEGNKHFQEEDASMVNITTKQMAPAVYNEISKRVESGENFDDVVQEYFHVNESGKKFSVGDFLSQSAFDKLEAEGGAEEFASFPQTQDFFTQARGFSKVLEGLSDEVNSMMGPDDGSPTLGIRAAAAGRYMSDVKKELQGMLDTEEIGKTPYATVYLADQAGESTADTGRISALGKMKEDPEFDALKIIGVYIHQPAERTRIANLHRASTGGRRVAQKEVDRIFKAGPDIGADGTIKNKGAALEAMEGAGFDQIHLYYPPDPFDPEGVEVDGQPIGNAICEPLGSGKGHLDIEGCDAEAEGPATGAKSLKGMEKYAVKQAQIPDEEIDAAGGGIPEDLESEEKEKIVAAFEKMGFSGVSTADLDKYLQRLAPPGVRAGGKHGKVPWGKDLFGGGTSPTEKITLKGESKDSRDDVLFEAWQKHAGLLK
jgi:hypothetical protein